MIHFILGGAGCGKSTVLQEKIQMHLEQEDSLITLVPEQFSYAFDKKLYRKLGAVRFNQLETHSFKSLVRAIFQRYGTNAVSAEYADETTQLAVLLQALFQEAEEHKSLRFFQSVWSKPDFFKELQTLLQLFRRNGMTAEQLFIGSSGLHGRLLEKTMDIVRIYQQYEYLMEQHQLRDTMTDLTEAAAIANMNDEFLGKIVVIDEFESFTEDEYEMLQVMFASCSDLYIALRTDDPQERQFTFFEPVNETNRRLQRMATDLHIETEYVTYEDAMRFAYPDLAFVSQSLFRSQITQMPCSEHIHIFEASDPYEEVEYICATIRHLLIEQPDLRCRDIAIVTNSLSDYQFILENCMEKYELPYHLDIGKSVMHTPLMVYTTTVLTFLMQKRIDTETIFRYGKTNLTDCTEIELAQLENYCYAWNISGKIWMEPFPGQTKDDLAMECVRKKLITPLAELKQAFSGKHTGTEFCTYLFSFLEQQQILEHMEIQFLKMPEVEQMQAREEFSFVWESIADLLDVLAKIDLGERITADRFVTILMALLKTLQMRIPPRTLDSIFIGQAKTSRLDEPKITFVLGASEGSFPAFAKHTLIYTERELQQLEQCKIQIGNSIEYTMAEEMLAVYKTVSSPSEALYLTYPLSDIEQQESYPSAVIGSVAAFFKNCSEMCKSSKTIDSSYYAVTKSAAYFRFMREYTKRDESIITIQALLMRDPYYQKKFETFSRLHQDVDFKIENRNVMKALVGESLTITATKFEQYQICPFQYFCSSGLQLFYRQRNTLNPSQSGSLIHYCLEQFLKQHNRDTFLSLTPEEICLKINTFSGKYFEQYLLGDYAKCNRELSQYRHLLRNLEDVVSHLQEELRQTKFYPAYLEVSIQPQNQQFPPMLLQTGTGETIRIVGKVDRVDTYVNPTTQQTWVRVVDYKSGIKTFSLNNLLYGLDVQMLIYLFTILQPGTPLEHAKPAGILYRPVGSVKKDLKRNQAVTVQEHKNDAYRMNGILLNDPEIIHSMEEQAAGVYVPAIISGAELKSRGNGILLHERELGRLSDYIKDKIICMAESVYSGVIQAAPLQLDSTMQPCLYCPYYTICGNAKYKNVRGASMSKKEAEEQMRTILTSEDNSGKGEDDAVDQ